MWPYSLPSSFRPTLGWPDRIRFHQSVRPVDDLTIFTPIIPSSSWLTRPYSLSSVCPTHGWPDPFHSHHFVPVLGWHDSIYSRNSVQLLVGLTLFTPIILANPWITWPYSLSSLWPTRGWPDPNPTHHSDRPTDDLTLFTHIILANPWMTWPSSLPQFCANDCRRTGDIDSSNQSDSFSSDLLIGLICQSWPTLSVIDPPVRVQHAGHFGLPDILQVSFKCTIYIYIYKLYFVNYWQQTKKLIIIIIINKK